MAVFRHLVTRWLITGHCCYVQGFKKLSQILIDDDDDDDDDSILVD
jgi:hypothetical protein